MLRVGMVRTYIQSYIVEDSSQPPGRSQVLWGERRLLLGCEDGSIPVFSLPAFKLGLSIKTHSKLIQCLALSPPLGGEGEREWLACT